MTVVTTGAPCIGRPTLPSLYFQHRGTPLRVQTPGSNEEFLELPSEVMHRCLVDFADWGDLAKLACVQAAWSGIVNDAAAVSTDAKWWLAQAYLGEICTQDDSDDDDADVKPMAVKSLAGLQPQPAKAMKLLRELANVPIDQQGVPAVASAPVTPSELDASSESDNMPTETVAAFAPAMKCIASCYLLGAGNEIPAEPAKGLKWLEASHTEGHDANAAHEVALIYEYGHYQTEIDVVAAAAWFQRAAEEAHHIEAMAELALCYELGCGVEQSDEKALDWYMKAAEQGHLTARYSVGEAFEEARGVPQSDEEACLWYYKAAIEGDEDSRKALRRLADIARIVVPGVRTLLEDV